MRTRLAVPGVLGLLGVLGVLALFALVGCSGDGTDRTPDDDPVKLLTDAKRTLDDTASVHVVIVGRDLPNTGQTLSKGDGVATHAPAFKGSLTVSNNGGVIDAEVVAVGGKVYAKPSFAPAFIEFSSRQLAELGAPDPAVFLDGARGITSILPAVQNPVVKGQSRQGSTVLTEVTGTIAGSTLAGIFPKARPTQQFPVSLKIEDSTAKLFAASVTGPFHGGADSSYDITFDRYGEPVEITKPS